MKDVLEAQSSEILRLQAGDVVVLRYPPDVTDTQLSVEGAAVKALLPDGVRFVMIRGAMPITVIRPEQVNP